VPDDIFHELRNKSSAVAEMVDRGPEQEWVHGSWVMGQMGHENWMGHTGHGTTRC